MYNPSLSFREGWTAAERVGQSVTMASRRRRPAAAQRAGLPAPTACLPAASARAGTTLTHIINCCRLCAGEQPVHDPEVYLLDYVPPELRVEVSWRPPLSAHVQPTAHWSVAQQAVACAGGAPQSPSLTSLLLPPLSCTPLPAPQVTRQFCVGFANCMAAAAYLTKQGQLPKPRLLAQMMSIVPGLDKR